MSPTPPARVIRGASDLTALRGVQEGEALEFKGRTWGREKAVEAAKDVASLANHRGGAIVLGVQQDADAKASVFAEWTDDSDELEIQRIRAHLATVLRPRDFVDRVEILALQTADGVRVAVVNVPASASLVAINKGSEKDPTLGFPVRSGRETRWMGLDEVEERMTTEGRGPMLILRRLRESVENRVEIISKIVRNDRRLMLGWPGTPLMLRDVGDEHATFDWTGTLSFVDTGGGVSELPINQREFRIPYGLMSGVYPRPGGGVFLELRVDILVREGGFIMFGRV